MQTLNAYQPTIFDWNTNDNRQNIAGARVIMPRIIKHEWKSSVITNKQANLEQQPHVAYPQASNFFLPLPPPPLPAAAPTPPSLRQRT